MQVYTVSLQEKEDSLLMITVLINVLIQIHLILNVQEIVKEIIMQVDVIGCVHI